MVINENVAIFSKLQGLTRRPTALVGLFLVGAFVFLAIFGRAIAPHSITALHERESLHPPSREYWFGTDQFGRDVFSRVVVGSRYILVLAVSATTVGVLLGTTVGLMAGYHGGLLDELIMRLMDVMMSFPSLLLALVILTTLGSNLLNLIATIGFVFTPRVARVVRSAVLGVKTKEFVDAAKVRGESSWYIMFREILPNVTGTILVEASIRVSYAILLGASLGFLGLGVQPPSPDWGLQISEGRKFILSAPWVVVFPALAVVLLVVGVNLLADGFSQTPGMPKESWRKVASTEDERRGAGTMDNPAGGPLPDRTFEVQEGGGVNEEKTA